MTVSLKVGPSCMAYVTWVSNFDVLLTVHLSIILTIDQLNAQILVLK
jgi:hypothetical protein